MPGELPTLDFSRRVTAQDAKLDKVEIEIRGWGFSGSTEDLDFFRQWMSVPSRDERQQLNPEGWKDFSLIFNRAENAEGRRKPLLIRDSNLGHRHPPLWSGKLKFSPYGNQNVNLPVNTITHFDVSVNPTRFARHQRFRKVPNSGQFLHVPTLCERVVPRQANGEYSLDDEDNWLPQGDALEFASPVRWLALLQNCFIGFLTHFEREVERIIARHDNRVLQTGSAQSFNLQTTETYYEFICESPTMEVARLEDGLRIFARNECEAQNYECRDLQTEQIFHSRCIRAELGKGRELVVYAKTNRRIRFEVRHKMVGSPPFTIPTGAPSRARSRGRGGGHVPTSHVANSWSGLVRMFHFIAGDAATVINDFFAFMQSRQNVTPSPVTAFLLMERILRCLPDTERAFELIRKLADDGVIRANVFPSAYGADIRALTSAGIIQLSRGTPSQRTYIVTQEYIAALSRLRELAESVPMPMPQPVPRARVRLPASTPQI